MIKLRVLALILTMHFCINAQNLVMNPSFEDTISCSLCQNICPPQLPCSYWYWATGGSVDYFNNYCGDTTYYSTPLNVFGFQNARTGTAYCGIGVYLSPIFQPAGYREYLGGQLNDTLRQGLKYCVSFYLVKADSGRYYTDDIGIYISPDSAVDFSTSIKLSYLPQIVNTNGIIYDTLNWVKISGNYIAQGGEKYFTIGNFNDDSNTTLDSNNQANLANAGSYYFIDDVSVVDCTVGINEIKNQQLQLNIAPNPVKDKLVLQLQNTKGNNCSLTIFNAMGATVLEQTIDKNAISIDVSQFNAGVYFVKVSEASGVAAVKRFVKL